LASYRYCINKSPRHVLQKLAYCGKIVTNRWHFVDLVHWAQNREAEGRLMGCTECLSVVRDLTDREE
jgi:hypothetical protein